MGYGPVINGKQTPITPWAGSWAATVNNPTPRHVRDTLADQHAATHTKRVVIRTMTHEQYKRMMNLP